MTFRIVSSSLIFLLNKSYCQNRIGSVQISFSFWQRSIILLLRSDFPHKTSHFNMFLTNVLLKRVKAK